MPTERKRAVRTAAAWTANQAEMEALYGVGNYYTTLSAWEAGEQANLTTLDEIRTAVCYDDWPTGLDDQVNISGWTTSSTQYVVVTTAEGHRHDGTPGSGFFISHALTADFTSVFTVGQQFTRLFGIEVRDASTSGTWRTAIGITGSNAYADACIASSPRPSGTGFRITGFGSYAANCLAVSASYRGFSFAANSNKAYSCISVGAERGYDAEVANNSTVKNCCAYLCTTGYSGQTFKSDSTNNASSAASGAPGNNPVHNVTSAAFVNAAANDFHLSAGSVLRGAGVNLYSDFTTDIDGDTWPSTGAWDIGFDYYVAAGGGPTINSITASNITQTGARITLGLTR